jgi:hypothetical protein
MRGPVPAWGSIAIVLEFGEGYRGASGYVYSGEEVTPVACSWPSIELAVQAYLATLYAAGDALPITILVQFDRATGRYAVTFEVADEERWKPRPSNWRQMREDLRPSFD